MQYVNKKRTNCMGFFWCDQINFRELCCNCMYFKINLQEKMKLL